MDALNPRSEVLIKLGSALVHADEAMSENGVALDEVLFRNLLTEPDVEEWLKAMGDLALLPLKRGPR